MLVKEGAKGGGGGGKGCSPLNPFPVSARVFYLFYMERRNRFTQLICFRDTVTLYDSTFAGLLCTSVIPGVKHSVKFKMASTCSLETGTFESKGRFNISKTQLCYKSHKCGTKVAVNDQK